MDMHEEVGHCDMCGICWRRWLIFRGVDFSGGSGTLREVWNMLRGGGSFVSGVEYAGVSGTWQEVLYMQEEVGHFGKC